MPLIRQALDKIGDLASYRLICDSVEFIEDDKDGIACFN
jgi:hypothetical protein